MKLGNIEIPDYVTTDSGEIIRSVDLLSEIRKEFRDLEAVLSFHHQANYLIARKVMWVIRRKYHYYYVGQKQFSLLCLVYLHYIYTGSTEFTLKELMKFNFAMTIHTLGKYMRYSRRSEFYEQITPGKYYITDSGLAIMRLISKEYKKYINKSMDELWKLSELLELW